MMRKPKPVCVGAHPLYRHFEPARELVPIKLVFTSCPPGHRGYCDAELAVLLPAEAGTHLPTPEGWTAELAGAAGRLKQK